MKTVFLIIMYVSGDGTYDVHAERTTSQIVCQTRGREFAENLLVNIPSVQRVSYRCKEVE